MDTILRWKIKMRGPPGVDPGAVVIFALYINDLPQCLQKTMPGLCADDTEIYASSHNVNDLIDNINYDLNIIIQWMKNNKLQIHPKKSKCMFIASPYKIKNIPQGIPILINNVPLPRVNCYKCLGVTLDERKPMFLRNSYKQFTTP